MVTNKELGQRCRIHQECWHSATGPLQVCPAREARSQLVQPQRGNGADLGKVAGKACELINASASRGSKTF